jgi:hypothetical protein
MTLMASKLPRIQSAADILVEQNSSRGGRTPKISRLRMTRLLAKILMGATLLIGSTAARAAQYRDITVDAVSPANSQRNHGYGEYIIAVTNKSSKDTHRVTLHLPLQTYFGGTVTRTVTVEPGSTANVSMFVSIPIGGDGLGVEIDGQLQTDIIAVNMSGGGGYAYETRPALLLSTGASGRGFQSRAAASLKPAGGVEDFVTSKAETAVTEWSKNWLGYSSYDGVIVTADEMRLMPEPVASALIKYVECGGTLVIFGNWRPPTAWPIDKDQSGPLSFYNAGFGVCIVSENAVMEALTPGNWNVMSDAWKGSQFPWSNRLTLSSDVAYANTALPVTENVSIPVRGLLLIMLFFVILIGPINLLVLAKKKKRMWLLWTVPVISLITCVAVSAYTLFSEGWGGRARYLSYTILDERSHRAATIGFNAFYAPLTPGDGLRYSSETEVNVLSSRYSYSYDSTPIRNSDWTEDQHLETGWVTARTPAHFTIRRNETRRERMTITRAGDGSISIVNGLGVTIKNIKFADEKGMVYAGSNIAAGSSVTLEPTNERLNPRPGTTRKAYAGDWIELVQRPLGAADLPRPMTYVADLETCPFLEDGLKGVRQKRCEARVLGIMKGPGDED